jgi:hypothetical protein
VGLCRRSSLLVFACLIALAPRAHGQSVTYWERDAFDWLAPGALAGRNGWGYVSGASPEVKGEGTLCGALAVPAAGGMIVKDVGTVTGRQELRFRVLIEAGGAALLDLEMPAGGRLLRFELGSAVRALSPNAPAVVMVAPVSTREWYAIRAVLDLDAGVATVFVDGRAAGSVALPGRSMARLRLTGSPAAGRVYLADLFGFAPLAEPALPTPNHAIGFGYFHTQSRWGDFRAETAAFTSLFRADAAAYPGARDGDTSWMPAFEESLYEAMRSGQRIVLALDQARCADFGPAECTRMMEAILGRAEPYWSFVDSIELADEPGWDRAEMEARVDDLRFRLANRALEPRPIGVVLGKDDLTRNDQVVQARGLDWVGIEAYEDPPGLDDPATAAGLLARELDTSLLHVPLDKQIVLVLQGYDRNGAWTNEGTLAALQTPPYEAAAGNRRVRALLAFAYGRCGGTHAYPSLEEKHESLFAALSRWNRAPAVALTAPLAGTLAGASPIRLAASAVDLDGQVRRVEFYQATSPVAVDNTPPFEAVWTPPGPGVYQLFARAWDDKDAVSISAPVVVRVGALPRLAVDDAVVSAPDGQGTARFTVTLSAASGAPVTVAYATADGSARAGRDYAAAAGGLTFPPGAVTRTIDIATLRGTDDATFRLVLSEPVNATAGRATGTGSIVHPVTATVSVEDASVREGDGGTSLVGFTVRLSEAVPRALTVDYRTEDGTAVAGRDYDPRSGTIAFAPGQTARTIVVSVFGNTVVDGPRTFAVRLTGASLGTLDHAAAVATIVDDDPAKPASVLAVYRLFGRGLTSEHLYTSDRHEYDVLGSTYDLAKTIGWMPEGLAYRIFDGPGTGGGVPLYRLYDTASHQHHWTTDPHEVRVLADRAEWSFEGTVGYVLPGAAAGTRPLSRLSNHGALHLWTIDANEKSVLCGSGTWFDEGVIGHVYSPSVP